MKNTRIIGLGNSILRDDGVGIHAAREIGRRLAADGLDSTVDIVETEVAGFALMELMNGWKRIILLDCIQFDDLEPGSVIRIDPADLRTSLRIRSVHEIDLPTVLELGRRLGFAMPEKLVIFGIQAEDSLSFGESLTDAAKNGMRKAVDLALQELKTEIGFSNVA
jgi:hydrogenase maturation protease